MSLSASNLHEKDARLIKPLALAFPFTGAEMFRRDWKVEAAAGPAIALSSTTRHAACLMLGARICDIHRTPDILDLGGTGNYALPERHILNAGLQRT
jgi:hypothetical protein